MIFNKIFKGFTIILVLSFTILSCLLYPLLGNYVVSEKEKTLFNAANGLSAMSSDFALKNFNDYKDLFRLSFDVIGQNLNTDVILADNEGNILLRTQNKNINISVERISEDILRDIKSGEPSKKVGKIGTKKETVLTVGVPVLYKNTVIGGIYLLTTLPEISKLRGDILRIHFLSVLAVFLISMIVIYMVSRNITQPINALTKASKALSTGEFETRVKIYKEDEIGELAKAFNDMADSLSKVEYMRRTFISDVSHELRTPMTTITGFVEGVLDGTIPDNKKDEYLKIVLDESKRISKLVSDLLDISKLTSDKIPLELEKFDINELIRLTIIAFEGRLNEKKLTVNVTFENEVEEVLAEKDSIKRVVTNLIDNAVKFSDDKGNIDINVKRKDDKVKVSIKNEGIGISDKEKKTIFERFYKLDKSRSQNKDGVGLGLYIVKSIIDKHNEKIWIESESDKYTQFTFSLKHFKK